MPPRFARERCPPGRISRSERNGGHQNGAFPPIRTIPEDTPGCEITRFPENCARFFFEEPRIWRNFRQRRASVEKHLKNWEGG